MKYMFAVIVLTLSLTTQAQKIQRLDNLSSRDTVVAGQAVICGSFIQRLGFKSGGFAQEIYITDLASKQIYVFRVKPIFKSAKENLFAYHIKPGTYAVLKYQYFESKWYGAKEFQEPIEKLIGGYYTFTVEPNCAVNLGEWHFDKFPVSFSASSDELKNKLNTEYSHLKNFTTTVPK